jgi:alkylation response protein AidB-like acyl-CoA dehydrogenase
MTAASRPSLLLYREAAFMLIGEGTSDIQKMIIGRSLLKDYKLGS